MLGSIEAGGTKINCAVGDEQGNIFKQVQFETTSPDENMKQIIDFFLSKEVEAIGIACFGPVNIDRQSSHYGYSGHSKTSLEILSVFTNT